VNVQGGEDYLAKMVASAVAYGSQIAKNMYFNTGHFLGEQVYIKAARSIGPVASLVIDTFDKIINIFSCIQTISYAAKNGKDVRGTRLTYVRSPTDDDASAQALDRLPSSRYTT
jgi:hypothetical protein